MTTIEPTTPKFKVHTSTHLFLSQEIYFQLTIFQEDSVFVWVGNQGNELLNNLAIAMPPPTLSMPATATTALISDVDEYSKQFGKKLASKFKKQFFVSVNLQSNNNDSMIFTFAERKVLDLIKEIFP